jgi:hypothetical protein
MYLIQVFVNFNILETLDQSLNLSASQMKAQPKTNKIFGRYLNGSTNFLFRISSH